MQCVQGWRDDRAVVSGTHPPRAGRCMAGTGLSQRVPLEKRPHEIVGGNVLGRFSQPAVSLRVTARPGVAAAFNYDQRDFRSIAAWRKTFSIRSGTVVYAVRKAGRLRGPGTAVAFEPAADRMV